MSNPDYDFGISTKEWITLDGHNVGFFLSDNTQIWINADDPDAPSSWSVTVVDEYGAIIEDLTAFGRLPVKAGAVEFARAAIAKRGLETVPSPEQASRGWNQARPAERFSSSNGLTVIDPPGKREPEAPAFDPVALAKSLAAPIVRTEPADEITVDIAVPAGLVDVQINSTPIPLAPLPVADTTPADPVALAKMLADLAAPKPPAPSVSSMPTDPVELAAWLAAQAKGN